MSDYYDDFDPTDESQDPSLFDSSPELPEDDYDFGSTYDEESYEDELRQKETMIRFDTGEPLGEETENNRINSGEHREEYKEAEEARIEEYRKNQEENAEWDSETREQIRHTDEDEAIKNQQDVRDSNSGPSRNRSYDQNDQDSELNGLEVKPYNQNDRDHPGSGGREETKPYNQSNQNSEPNGLGNKSYNQSQNLPGRRSAPVFLGTPQKDPSRDPFQSSSRRSEIRKKPDGNRNGPGVSAPEGFTGFGTSRVFTETGEERGGERREYRRLDKPEKERSFSAPPSYDEYDGRPGPYLGTVLNTDAKDKDQGGKTEEDDSESKDFLSFIQSRDPKDELKKSLIIALAVFYLALLMLQSLSLASYINPDGIGNNTGTQTFELDFTLNPVTIIMRNPAIVTFICVMFGLIAGGTYCYVRLFKKGVNGKPYVLSDKGTYGTAKPADDEAIKDKVTFSTRNRPEGLPLGISEETYKAVCVPPKAQSNKNTAVFGASGSGKSYSFVRPAIMTCIDKKASYVVTDPSGELYTDTAKLAKESGMNVKILNLKDFSSSDGWNPFSAFTGMPREEVQTRVEILANTIVSNSKGDNVKGDAFFDNAELSLLKALIAYVAATPKPYFLGEEYERHLGTVYDMIVRLAGKGGSLPEMDELPENSPAKVNWNIFKAASEGQRAGFIQGIAGKLQVLQNDMLKEVLSHDEIKLTDIGREPTAVYVISSVNNDAYRFILSLFFSLAFEDLITEAEESISGKLDIPVYFLFDEFKSIGTINNFSNKLANVRKYDIAICIIFQDPGQIESNYPRQSKSILSNCERWLVLGVNDEDTAKLISSRSGEATIINKSLNETRTKHAPVQIIPEQRVSIADGKRMVLTPDEVLRMPSDEAIIILRTKNAYVCQKYGWPNHYLAEYVDAPSSKTHYKEHIPEWQNHEKTMDRKRTFADMDLQIERRQEEDNRYQEQEKYQESSEREPRQEPQKPQKPQVYVPNVEGVSGGLPDMATLKNRKY